MDGYELEDAAAYSGVGKVSVVTYDAGDSSDEEAPEDGKFRKVEVVPKAKKGQRELMSILTSTGKELVDLDMALPSLTRQGVYTTKLQPSIRRPRKWFWAPFKNEARNDGLELCHWLRQDRKRLKIPYLFAKFSNQDPGIPTFTDEEYEEHLENEDWTKEETMYLLEVCGRFDLRWPIVFDRYDQTVFGEERTMEDLKERFYSILSEVEQLRSPTAPRHDFDADNERKRKDQLERLWSRTSEEWIEEQQLKIDMERLEQKRRQRERRALELQRLITTSYEMAAPASPSANSAALMKKNQSRGRAGALMMPTPNVNLDLASTQLRFSEFRGSGVHLRSQEMKLPTNLGQKKLKNIETVLEKLKLDMNPLGSEKIVAVYNEFRSQIMLLQELKATLQTTEYDLETVAARLQQQGTMLEIDPKLRVSTLPEGGLSNTFLECPGAPLSRRRITSYLELLTKADGSHTRKRKITGPTHPPAAASPTPPEIKRTRKSSLL
ncbi:unnamed protein product, partial [Mesorhabditis spiculigera]